MLLVSIPFSLAILKAIGEINCLSDELTAFFSDDYV
jgi:hypothetical protein